MNGIFKKIIENTSLQTFVVVAGVAITLVNSYIAVTIAPLANNITANANAIYELKQNQNSIQTIKETIATQTQQLKDIQSREDRIENKLDNILAK